MERCDRSERNRSIAPYEGPSPDLTRIDCPTKPSYLVELCHPLRSLGELKGSAYGVSLTADPSRSVRSDTSNQDHYSRLSKIILPLWEGIPPSGDRGPTPDQPL